MIEIFKADEDDIEEIVKKTKIDFFDEFESSDNDTLDNREIKITNGSVDTYLTDDNYYISGIYVKSDMMDEWVDNPDITVKAGKELDMGAYTFNIDSFKEVDDVDKDYLASKGAEAVYEVTYTVNNKSYKDTSFYGDLACSMTNVAYVDSERESGMDCVKLSDIDTDTYSMYSYGEKLGVGSSKTKTFYIAARHAGKGCFLLRVPDENGKELKAKIEVKPTK